MPNRYFTLQGTTFDDIPLIQPDFEGIEESLATQQQLYDVTKTLADKKPKHLQPHAENVQNYISGVRSGIDDVSATYANLGIQAGNKARNELLRKVSRDWQPGGEAYAFEDVYNTYHGLSKEYKEKFKDDPNFMNKYAQNHLAASIKEWDYDPETETYSNVKDPQVSEYVDIQKEVDGIIEGFKADGYIEDTINGGWISRDGSQHITEEGITNMTNDLLRQERFQQQLQIEQWNKYGFDEKPPEGVLQQIEKDQKAMMTEGLAMQDLEMEEMQKTLEGRKQLQVLLKNSGLYSGKIDGIIGKKSKAALKELRDGKVKNIANHKVEENYFLKQLKEEYVRPMVEKYAFRDTTHTIRAQPYAMADYKHRNAMIAQNALIAAYTPPKPNYIVTDGKTSKTEYVTIGENIENAEDAVTMSEGQLVGTFTEEHQNAFYVTDVATENVLNGGNVIGDLINNIANAFAQPTPANLNKEALVNITAVSRDLEKRGITKDSKNYNEELKKGYIARVSEINPYGYSDTAIQAQADLLTNPDTRGKMYDVNELHSASKRAYNAAVNRKENIIEAFDNTKKGKQFWEEEYEKLKSKITDPKIKNVEDFKLASKNGTLKIRITARNEKGYADLENVVSSRYEQIIEKEWNQNPEDFNLNSNSVIFTGTGANKDIGREMIAMIEDEGLKQMLTPSQLDEVGFRANGVDGDVKVTNANFAVTRTGGKQEAMIQITTEYIDDSGEKKEGKTLVPYNSMTKATRDNFMLNIWDTTVIGNGDVIDNPQSIQNNAVISEVAFDNAYNANTYIDDRYLGQTVLQKNQTQDLREFYTYNDNGDEVQFNIVRAKPSNKSLSGEYVDDTYYILSNTEYKDFKREGGGKADYLNSIGAKSFNSLSALKQNFGRRYMKQEHEKYGTFNYGTPMIDGREVAPELINQYRNNTKD